MILTIKHYGIIAGIIREHTGFDTNRGDYQEGRVDSADGIGTGLADLFALSFNMFQSDDERFDREKFLKDCGIE